MTDRTVKVSLIASAAGYVKEFEKAQKATKKTTDDAKKQLEEQRQSMEKVGVGALLMGTAIAAGVLYAVKTFAEFDAKMSQVQALSHATASEMGQLTDAALSVGQGIGFTAGQVADAETELVKAGVSVKDMLGGSLIGALNLAAAGQIDVGQATQIAAVAMTQFKLAGKDVPHLADLLAAGADKALGGVDQLGQALNQGGLVAAQFGLSVDDTVGTLSAFANAGLLGSDAGTSFKQMLLSLASPSKKAADTMQEYNIQAYDATGHFVGITNLAGQLSENLGHVSQAQRDAALSTIFGSDAIRSANVLLKEGSTGIQDWIDKVNDQGFAAQQARAKMDNLNGDITKLGASFENILIKSGSGANDSLRGLTQTVTGLVTAFAQAPAWIQGVTLGLAGLTAGVLILGGGFLILTPKIAAARLAMQTMGITGRSLATTFGKGGGILLAIGVLVQGLSGLGQVLELTDQQIDQLNASLKAGVAYSSFDNLFKTGTQDADGFKASLEQLQSTDFFKNQGGNLAFAKFAKSATGGLVNMWPELQRTEAQFRQLGTTLADVAKTDFPTAADQFGQFVAKAGGGNEAVRKLLAAMPAYKDELVALAAAQGVTLSTQDLYNVAQGKGELAARLAAAATVSNTAAIQAMQGQALDATGAIQGLADKISGFGKGQMDVNAAERDFQAAIDAVTQSIKDNGTSLDITSDAGRQNQAALDGIAKTALTAASAIYTQTGSQDDATAAIANGRAELIRALGQYGITGAAADQYADKLGLIPGNVDTIINLNKSQAQKDLEEFERQWNSIQTTKVVTIVTNATNPKVGFGLGDGHADGGAIYGPGGPRDDTAGLFPLSNGEHVFTAADVDAMGGQAAVYAFRANLHRGFADGGSVDYVRASSYATAPRLTAAAAPQFNVVVQSKGGVDLLQYVDVRVEQAQQIESRTAARGYRG